MPPWRQLLISGPDVCKYIESTDWEDLSFSAIIHTLEIFLFIFDGLNWHITLGWLHTIPTLSKLSTTMSLTNTQMNLMRIFCAAQLMFGLVELSIDIDLV